MNKLIFVLCILFYINTSAQNKIIQIVDSATNDGIGRAQLITDYENLFTDEEGFVTIDFKNRIQQSLKIHQKDFTSKNITIDSTIENNFKIKLNSRIRELNFATVSGSRFKKRIAEEIVSIEVIKPSFIQNNAFVKADDALNKAPGVDVIDNQINIRGGSGWSYGAGSRVLVMVDDMPMLTADASDAKWDFLPIENCEQIEILKGASSALYGSSALNGVVNFRTAYAKNKPITKIQFLGTMYGMPKQKSFAWWKNDSANINPYNVGINISHSRKIKNADLVFGAALYKDFSYLLGDTTRRARFNINYRQKISKKLSAGINTNIQFSNNSTFLFHVADSNLQNLYMPYAGTVYNNKGFRFNIDPNLQYNTSKNWQHHLRTRFYMNRNLVENDSNSSTGKILYAEYQIIKRIGEIENKILKNSSVVAGAVGNFQNVEGLLYGNHQSTNMALYAQIEKKIIKNLWLSSGIRYESFVLDTFAKEAKPVFRIGANYELMRGTNIRMSYGQGYRYPSIAERFVLNSFGAASVYPNPNLKSETGQSFELGIKQGLSFGKWLGYFDASFFDMRYNDMIEFNFGTVKYNNANKIGFQSRNIGDTKIQGVDASIMGQGKIGKCNVFLMTGYTYINPTQLVWDSAIKSNYSTNNNFLKYRYKHSAKLNIELGYKKWTLASLNTYNSAMINIDEVFEANDVLKNFYGNLFNFFTNGLSTSIRKYRQQYNKGVINAELRLTYAIMDKYKIGFFVRNLTNVQYYVRPALPNAPRTIGIQFNTAF